MSSPAAKQLATAKAFVDGWNEWTTEGILRIRTEDCLHEVYPASLDRPPRNNKEYGEFIKFLQEHDMKNFKMEIVSIVNDTEQRTAVVHARATADAPWMPYRNEYAFFLKFTEDRDKVEHIGEFVDSKFGTEFFAKLQEYLDKQK